MHKRLHCSCHQIQSYRFSFSANNWVQMAHTVATVILHYVQYENLDCPLEQVVINVLIFFLLKKAYRNRVNRLEKRVLAARGGGGGGTPYIRGGSARKGNLFQSSGI